MLNVTRRSKSLKAALLVLALTPVPFSAAPLAGQTGRIDTVAIRTHTRFLAHDSLAGRGTGSPGGANAARYIARQCRELGLEPLGHQYLLPFDLIESVIDAARSSLLISSGGTQESFQAPQQFFPGLGRFESDTHVTGRAVFVANDDVPNRGKPAPPQAIAVTLGIPRGPAVQILADRGFIAAIHIAPDPSTYELAEASRGPSRLAHAGADVASSLLPPIPTIIVGTTVAQAWAQGAQRRGDNTIVLNANIDLHIAANVTTSTVNNVGCVRPGTDRTRVTAFSAHFDHLGISTPDANGDSIYNGFSDNAAGVAMLLAIAKATGEEPPASDMAFLFFTGEERGLLGSDAFVHNPPIPLQRLRAVINLDAGAPPAPPMTWRIAGDNTSLRAAAVSMGEGLGWAVATSGPSPNTDYFPFYRLGVPAVFVVPGPGPYEGMSQRESDNLKDRWDGYHQAHDHWYPDFPFSGLERYADYALAIAEAYRP